MHPESRESEICVTPPSKTGATRFWYGRLVQRWPATRLNQGISWFTGRGGITQSHAGHLQALPPEGSTISQAGGETI